LLKEKIPSLFNTRDKNQDSLRSSSLKKSFTMTIPTFVDLQGFIVGKKFVVKEVAMFRKGAIFTHYIFMCPMPWNFLIKSEKYCAS